MEVKMAYIGHLLNMPASLTYIILLNLYSLSIIQMMKLGFSDLPEVTQQRVD